MQGPTGWNLESLNCMMPKDLSETPRHLWLDIISSWGRYSSGVWPFGSVRDAAGHSFVALKLRRFFAAVGEEIQYDNSIGIGF